MPPLHMRYPGGLAKAVTFSYDDGVIQDIRLVDIFNRNALRGTFNINSSAFDSEQKDWVAPRLTYEQALALFSNTPHELAVHTLSHPCLEQLPTNMAAYEVLKDRQSIEDMFGTICRGMAYPFGFSFGANSAATVDVLRNCGILYSRTTAASHNLAFPSDWLRLKPTCHHNSPRLDEMGDKLLHEAPVRAPWLLYVWGHSYEFDEDNNWETMEQFAQKIGGHDDIWYATNLEIFEYAEDYRRLCFSNKGDRVYNPTARELFFHHSYTKKGYSVKPGETIELN